MNIEQLKADFAARGGKVTRVATGKRAMRESYMRDVTGNDDDRRTALERLADAWERKAQRKARRKARRDVRRALDAALA